MTQIIGTRTVTGKDLQAGMMLQAVVTNGRQPFNSWRTVKRVERHTHFVRAFIGPGPNGYISYANNEPVTVGDV